MPCLALKINVNSASANRRVPRKKDTFRGSGDTKARGHYSQGTLQPGDTTVRGHYSQGTLQSGDTTIRGH